jgi:hypothetical protein
MLIFLGGRALLNWLVLGNLLLPLLPRLGRELELLQWTVFKGMLRRRAAGCAVNGRYGDVY